MCNESRIAIGSHCTTHIDAPYHFDESGKRIDQIDPDVLVGPAWLLHVDTAGDEITLEDLLEVPDTELTRVLFKTRNTGFLGSPPFHTDYVGLASDAARFLVDRGCRMVGIDYYSICPYRDLKTTHEILLGSDVVIIEGLVLGGIAASGPVEMIALPLRLTGGDASPARVLIREREGRVSVGAGAGTQI
jgi:arylformamidase